MALSSLQKLKLEVMLKVGDDQKATEYLQQELNMTAEEAAQAVEKLKPSVSSLKTNPLHTYTKQKNKSKTGSTIGVVFLLAGLAMVGFSGYLWYSNNEFMKSAISVTGVVIDFNTHYSDDDDGGSTLMYSPVFEYEYNRQTYTHTSDVSSSSPGYDVGEETEIYIHPDAPEKALVNSFMEKWFGIILLGGMGILFTGAGYFSIRFG